MTVVHATQIAYPAGTLIELHELPAPDRHHGSSAELPLATPTGAPNKGTCGNFLLVSTSGSLRGAIEFIARSAAVEDD